LSPDDVVTCDEAREMLNGAKLRGLSSYWIGTLLRFIDQAEAGERLIGSLRGKRADLLAEVARQRHEVRRLRAACEAARSQLLLLGGTEDAVNAAHVQQIDEALACAECTALQGADAEIATSDCRATPYCDRATKLEVALDRQRTEASIKYNELRQRSVKLRAACEAMLHANRNLCTPEGHPLFAAIDQCLEALGDK
jgi:hypothetical protein